MRAVYADTRIKRWTIGIATALLFIVMALWLAPFVGGFIMVSSAKRDIEANERKILYHTDHTALLAACRQAMKTLPPGDYGDDVVGGKEQRRLPEPIRQLKANYIVLDRDSFHIEMGGGFYHYGLEATSQDTPSPGTSGKQLIPGLYYYAEDGRVPSPD